MKFTSKSKDVSVAVAIKDGNSVDQYKVQSYVDELAQQIQSHIGKGSGLHEVKQFQKIAGILKEDEGGEREAILRIVQDNYGISDAVQEFLGWDEEQAEDADGTNWDDVVDAIVNNPKLKASVLGGKEHYRTAQDFVNHVFEILNDEMRAGYFSEKGLNRADMYLDKYGEELAKSGKSAKDVADDLMAKFTTARP